MRNLVKFLTTCHRYDDRTRYFICQRNILDIWYFDYLYIVWNCNSNHYIHISPNGKHVHIMNDILTYNDDVIHFKPASYSSNIEYCITKKRVPFPDENVYNFAITDNIAVSCRYLQHKHSAENSAKIKRKMRELIPYFEIIAKCLLT